MGDLITAVSTAVSGMFTAIITAFADIGNLLFVFTEGAISGISPFGYFLALMLGFPIAVWLFNKVLGLIKKIMPGASAR